MTGPGAQGPGYRKKTGMKKEKDRETPGPFLFFPEPGTPIGVLQAYVLTFRNMTTATMPRMTLVAQAATAGGRVPERPRDSVKAKTIQ